MGFPETSVTHYQSALRNVPEERIYNVHRDGSPKSYFGLCSYSSFLQAEDAMFCKGGSVVCTSVRWVVDRVWNVMAHAQKPDFVFRQNGQVHLNRRVASVQSTTGKRGVRISGSNAGYTMFRDSVKSTGYPLHSPVSPPLPLPCVTVCHHISTGLYMRVRCGRGGVPQEFCQWIFLVKW